MRPILNQISNRSEARQEIPGLEQNQRQCRQMDGTPCPRAPRDSIRQQISKSVPTSPAPGGQPVSTGAQPTIPKTLAQEGVTPSKEGLKTSQGPNNVIEATIQIPKELANGTVKMSYLKQEAGNRISHVDTQGTEIKGLVRTSIPDRYALERINTGDKTSLKITMQPGIDQLRIEVGGKTYLLDRAEIEKASVSKPSTTTWLPQKDIVDISSILKPPPGVAPKPEAKPEAKPEMKTEGSSLTHFEPIKNLEISSSLTQNVPVTPPSTPSSSATKTDAPSTEAKKTEAAVTPPAPAEDKRGGDLLKMDELAKLRPALRNYANYSAKEAAEVTQRLNLAKEGLVHSDTSEIVKARAIGPTEDAILQRHAYARTLKGILETNSSVFADARAELGLTGEPAQNAQRVATLLSQERDPMSKLSAKPEFELLKIAHEKTLNDIRALYTRGVRTEERREGGFLGFFTSPAPSELDAVAKNVVNRVSEGLAESMLTPDNSAATTKAMKRELHGIEKLLDRDKGNYARRTFESALEKALGQEGITNESEVRKALRMAGLGLNEE